MPDYTEEFTNIPYGPLGIIALPGCESSQTKLTATLLNGVHRSSRSTRTALLSQAMKRTPTSSTLRSPVSEQAKVRVHFLSR